jgi:hypothetical protein
MPTITAPNIEVTQVVTGYMYELTISEEDNGSGITQIDFGPYKFPGAFPKIEYPESVTNESCPAGWSQIGWYTDTKGQSWLSYKGGVISPKDGEALFQFTSNYPASAGAGPKLVVWHGSRAENFDIPVPDYSVAPPLRNSRHDCTGLGLVYKQAGCLPQTVLLGLLCAGIVMLFLH